MSTNAVKNLRARMRNRPIRIAFIVPKDVSHENLSEIFDFCNSVWTGRYFPVVFAENGRIEPAYWPWLKAFDADFLCTLHKLSDSELKRISDDFDPAAVVDLFGSDTLSKGDIESALKTEPLSSLANIAFQNAVSFSTEHPRRLFDVWDWHSDSRALVDTFGSYGDSFGMYPPPEPLASRVKTISLTDKTNFEDQRRGPKPIGEVIHSEADAWLTMLSRRTSCLSTLSAVGSPRLELRSHMVENYFQLVVGDQISDRVLHWNILQFFPKWRDGTLCSVRVSEKELRDPSTLKAISEYCNRFNNISQNGVSGSYVAVRSVSQSKEQLETLVGKLKQERIRAFYKVHAGESDVDIFTASGFAEDEKNDRWSFGRNFGDWEEFWWDGSTATPPNKPPSPLITNEAAAMFSRGSWMVDFAFDRKKNLSPYINAGHLWKFSRRLRMANAIGVESRGPNNPLSTGLRFRRIEKRGYFSATSAINNAILNLNFPTEKQLFQFALARDGERYPEDFPRFVPRAPFKRVERSDKGAYLDGFLGLLGGLGAACDFLLHRFWDAQLQSFGASASPDPDASSAILEKLKKTYRTRNVTKGDFPRISEVAAAVARKHRAPQRAISYRALCSDWGQYRKKFWDSYFEQHKETNRLSAAEQEDWDKSEEQSLDAALNELVSKQVLFQGLSSTCGNCLHENWITVDKLSSQNECAVCGHLSHVPFDVNWQFRLNEFALESVREHGMQAMIWALNICRNRAESSFYYLGPCDVFSSYEGKQTTDMDITAVINSESYVIEVKSSKSNFGEPAQKDLVKIAELVRPNKVIAAVMSSFSTEQRKAVENSMSERLLDCPTDFELWSLDQFPLSEGTSLW